MNSLRKLPTLKPSDKSLDEMDYNTVADFLTREAIKICALHDVSVPRPLMKYIVKWLTISHAESLLNANKEETLQIYHLIYDQIIDNGPVIRMLKMTHFFENCTFDQREVQKKYEEITRNKLAPLLDNICSSSGTTLKEHEELVKEMTTYIVASNKLFSPKNSQLMSVARMTLLRITTKQDLLDFMSRKKRYQKECLQNWGKIMCGIMVFNKHTRQHGDDIRDIVDDVHMAYDNTVEALRQRMKYCSYLIKLGLKAISTRVTIDLKDRKLLYKLPECVAVEDLQMINKFTYLHLQYESFLKKLRDKLVNLKDLIDYDVGQLQELIFKFHDEIKYQTEPLSESAYPICTKIFETWYKILMRMYYLVDINQVNDKMAELVSSDYPFEEMACRVASMEDIVTLKVPLFEDDDEGELEIVSRRTITNSCAKSNLQKYCFLTLATSNGFLQKSDSTLGVLPFNYVENNEYIACRRRDYLAYTDKHYKHLVQLFLRVAFKNPEMCLLFDIPLDLPAINRSSLESPFVKKAIESVTQTFNAGVQTENCIPPATIAQRNTYSWNIWDYHRRAIQLANLRKSKTRSMQTNLTYCKKNAAVQTYDKRESTHRCNDSASQLSILVCPKLGDTRKAEASDCLCCKKPPRLTLPSFVPKARKPGCCPQTRE